MWVVRELARLLLKVALAVAVALVLAALLAAVSDRSLTQSLRAICLGLGCIALLMGAVGRGSNIERSLDARVSQRYLGRIPGVSTLQSGSDDPTLSAGAVFFVTGVVLVALGALVF